jgi:hypothetical protein
MAQSDVEYDEQSGRILYVYNRICLKADCSFRKLKHQKTTRCLSMSAPQKKELQKQILLPSFLFSHFETKLSGDKLVSDKFSYKVALCFEHLTTETQTYYRKHKVLPENAQIKQNAAKIGKVYSPSLRTNQNYYWTGIKYSRQALHNLFECPKDMEVVYQEENDCQRDTFNSKGLKI